MSVASLRYGNEKEGRRKLFRVRNYGVISLECSGVPLTLFIRAVKVRTYILFERYKPYVNALYVTVESRLVRR